jgi:hypothetical protein
MNIAMVQWGSNTDTSEAPPLGNVPTARPDSTFRLLSVQINNLSVSRHKNTKASVLQWLIKRYGVNLVGIGEVGLNMSLMKNGYRFLSVFLSSVWRLRALFPTMSMKTSAYISRVGSV